MHAKNGGTQLNNCTCFYLFVPIHPYTLVCFVSSSIFFLIIKKEGNTEICLFRAFFFFFWLMITYIVLFSTLLSRLTALACGSTWVTSFITRFLNIHQSGVLTVLAWLVLHETAAVSAQILCIPYNHAPCHFMQSHIHKVHACLAVTCHLHFWQNDRDFLHATAVTQGWNGYRNKSQHRKSTLEKKILPPLQ